MKNRTEVQDDLIGEIPPNPHGRLLLAPRVGKSRIVVRVIKRDKPKSILWVTPSRELADKDIPAEFVKWKAKTYLPKLRTTTWKSLEKETGHYGLIVLDEYQDITELNASQLLNGNLTADNILAVSGTDPKHEEKLEIYKKLGLEIIASIGIDEAVDLNLIADYHINVLEVSMDNTNKIFEGGNKQNRFYQTELSRYGWLDRIAKQAMFGKRSDTTAQIIKRMHFIKGSPSKEQAAKFLISKLSGRKVVFCASIEQSERIFPHSFYHSKTNNLHLNKFLAGESDELALVNAGGVGFTYNGVRHFIIIQADSDNKGLTTQKLARALLEQGISYKASIWVLKLIGTQDCSWVDSFLSGFDTSKITVTTYYDFVKNVDNLINEL